MELGGIHSDPKFGRNGRILLQGLIADPCKAILDRLSCNTRGWLEALGDALSLTLADRERGMLTELMAAGEILQAGLHTVRIPAGTSASA